MVSVLQLLLKHCHYWPCTDYFVLSCSQQASRLGRLLWPATLCAHAQNYGRELNEAYECTQKYRQSRREAELHQAWDMYYHVFKRINKQLPTLTVLDLQYVAPALVRAQVRSHLMTQYGRPMTAAH